MYDQHEADKPECWQEGRISPHGHTISVSDIWFVAHYYGLLTTILGAISSVNANNVTTTRRKDVVSCNIILKCTGYWKNEAVRQVLGSNVIHANSVVRTNLVYQADSILDDAGGFQTPYGSSYLEAAALQVLALMGTVWTGWGP